MVFDLAEATKQDIFKSTGVGCHFLLQGIFPTQRSNPGLLHCRQVLYHLSHQGSPGYSCSQVRSPFSTSPIQLDKVQLHVFKFQNNLTLECEVFPSYTLKKAGGSWCMVGMAASRNHEELRLLLSFCSANINLWMLPHGPKGLHKRSHRFYR